MRYDITCYFILLWQGRGLNIAILTSASGWQDASITRMSSLCIMCWHARAGQVQYLLHWMQIQLPPMAALEQRMDQGTFLNHWQRYAQTLYLASWESGYYSGTRPGSDPASYQVRKVQYPDHSGKNQLHSHIVFHIQYYILFHI